MSRCLIVVGDRHSHGGTLTEGCAVSRVDGRAIVRENDEADCPIHGRARVIDASSRLTFYGRVAAYDGDRLDCGAELIGGLARVRHG